MHLYVSTFRTSFLDRDWCIKNETHIALELVLPGSNRAKNLTHMDGKLRFQALQQDTYRLRDIGKNIRNYVFNFWLDHS